jgi:chemotaxis protein methyltransferase CheR
MRVKGASSFREYGSLLDDDPLEYDRLIATLTINVSRFFRNPETFATIAMRLLPELAENAGRRIRIWSAGCASGEEAYSLAVLCHQQMGQPWERANGIRFDIVGTDVDAEAISAARRGRYGEAAFVDTTPSVRDTYFPMIDGLYSVTPELRDLVTFHRQDLLAPDSNRTRFHMIVCRNVIIYFQRRAQEQLIERFHDLLLPGGFLVLGKVESLLGKSREKFSPVRPRERVYRRL